MIDARRLQRHLEAIGIPANHARQWAEQYHERIQPSLVELREQMETDPTSVRDQDIPPEELGMVHVTDFLPKEGIITPTSHHAEAPRHTIHHTLNGMVQPVNLGLHAWTDKPIAVLTPVSETVRQWLHNVTVQDSFGVGALSLPKNSTILVRQDVASRKGLTNGQRLGEAEVRTFPESMKTEHAVAEGLLPGGIVPMKVGQYHWQVGMDCPSNVRLAPQQGEQHGWTRRIHMEDPTSALENAWAAAKILESKLGEKGRDFNERINLEIRFLAAAKKIREMPRQTKKQGQLRDALHEDLKAVARMFNRARRKWTQDEPGDLGRDAAQEYHQWKQWENNSPGYVLLYGRKKPPKPEWL